MKFKISLLSSLMFLYACDGSLPECTDSDIKEAVLEHMKQAKGEFIYKDVDLL